jgi:kojibiose phosphorylase
MNNIGKEGLHLACLGETWSSIFFGFLGANFNGDTPAFSPVLPTGWKALRMNFYWQGRIYHLAVSDNHYIVTIA